MSHQATFLGYLTDAANLTRAAQTVLAVHDAGLSGMQAQPSAPVQPLPDGNPSTQTNSRSLR